MGRVGVRGSASDADRERGPRPEQVCALQWSAHDKELVSSHGYSHNQLINADGFAATLASPAYLGTTVS